jgi:hypothetical protein
MKNHLNAAAMGLGLAVLGFAVYEYMKTQAAAGTQAAGAAVASNPNAGALWQNLTFPLGSATGGTNSVGVSNVYSSTAWNPDAISALIGQDTLNSMNASGQSTTNTWGFHL